MRWIILSIALFIVFYTYLNLRYRKPGPGYLPYQDARQKLQLAHAGYQRISLRVGRLADPAPFGDRPGVLPAPGGLPAALRSALFSAPILPTEIAAVSAPAAAAGDRPYPVRFRCEMADDRLQFYDAKFYLHGADVYVVPECERLAGGLRARRRDEVIDLTAPPGVLDPGAHRMILLGERLSKSWLVQVH